MGVKLDEITDKLNAVIGILDKMTRKNGNG